MGTIENFIESFYNLDGTTISEKERSFRKLIHKNISLLQDQKWNQNIVDKLIPRTHLEKLFKIDILITCEKTGELLEILTGGDAILIYRIIKHKWFIHETFQHMSAHDITDKLLPQLSYSIRMKILKKISIHLNDEDKLYELFVRVKSKYGMNVAKPLIIGCNEKRIESIIKSNPIFFTPTQLRHFIRKSPELLPIYVEEYIKHKDNYDFLQDRDLIQYICAIDYNVYFNLHKKYNFKIKLGKRTSRKMFETQKDKILEKPREYEDVFKPSVFIRKLCAYGSFNRYIVEFFPKKIDMFSYTKNSYMGYHLKFYPKSKRLHLLEECFEEVYKVSIYDCPHIISTDILDMISDSKKKQSIVDKIMKLDDDLKYVIYQKTSHSVPFLKKEMDLAANKIARRIDLIRALVETCKVNGDVDALKEVMKYINSRHRNDIKILLSFLKDLRKNYDFHTFDIDLWKLVIQLIELYKVKDESNIHRFMSDIYLTYSEFLFNESGDVAEEPLLEAMKCFWMDDTVIFSHTCSNLKFIRSAILKAIVLLPKISKKEYLYDGYSNFATRILSWNQHHKDYAISINDHPIFFESLKNQSGKYGCYCDVKALFCTKDRSDEVIEILDFYWSKSATFNREIVLYYLKWYPTTFLKDMKSSVTGLVRMKSCVNTIIKMINKYDYIELPQNIIKYIQETLVNTKRNNDDECDDEHDKTELRIISNIFAVLARLMNPEDYISYIAKYKPDKLILDMATDDKIKVFKVQRSAIENMKYLPSIIIIPKLMEYCGGDFVAYIFAGLYKSFYRVPENKLLPFINQLMKKSVSVKKHSITLASRLLDLKSIENIFKTLLAVEQNTSLQKRLRMSVFKLFQADPSDSFWSLFKYSLTHINRAHMESYESLVDMPYLPIKYRLIYYEEIWILLENSSLTEAHKYSLRNALCSKMTYNMKNLSWEMSLKVINTLFMKFSDMLMYDGSVINKFVCEFLYKNPKAEVVFEICNILDISKNSSLDISQSNADTFKEICIFIDDFCDYFFADNSRVWDVDVTKDFIQHLCNLYPHIEYFSEYVLASLVSILLELQGDSIKLYASEVSRFSRKMFDMNGPYVNDIIISNIIKSLEFFNKSHDYSHVKYEFMQEMLAVDKSEFSYKIMLEIMSTYSSDSSEYKEALNIINSCKYPSIQIILRQKSC